MKKSNVKTLEEENKKWIVMGEQRLSKVVYGMKSKPFPQTRGKLKLPKTN